MNDIDRSPALARPALDEKMDWISSIPFLLVHAACFAALFTGVRWSALAVCAGLYFARMSALTIGYHRYFAHRSFKTSRAFQFVLALAAATCAQKGPLWWAAHHRHHHRSSDQLDDVHSPAQRGFWWSHLGWILCRKYNETRLDLIRDFARFPELRWLDRYHLVPPALVAVALFLIGGWGLLVVGFFWSTVLLWHGTFTINSLSHVFGRRRYKTTDTSRNNALLALITCGEGWHNNHHYHQNTANQGWFWWEIDTSFYLLKGLERLGIVAGLRMPSESVKYAHRLYSDEERRELRRGGLVLKPTGRLLHRPSPQRVGARVRRAIAAASEALPSSSPTPALD